MKNRLLRKVDFYTYKSDGGHREHAIQQRYYLQSSLDYKKYNQLCGMLRRLAHRLSQLDPDSDPVRKKLESEVLDKLWRMGILKQSREQGAGLSRVEREVTVSAFCRRRLAVLMARSGMVETVKAVCLLFVVIKKKQEKEEKDKKCKVSKRERYAPLELCTLLLTEPARLSLSSSRAMSALAPKLSPTRRFSSRAIWRTLLLGLTLARSSGASCGTARSSMTLS